MLQRVCINEILFCQRLALFGHVHTRVVNLVQAVVKTLLKVVGNPQCIFNCAAAGLKNNHSLGVFCANSLSDFGGEGGGVGGGCNKIKPFVAVFGDIFG